MSFRVVVSRAKSLAARNRSRREIARGAKSKSLRKKPTPKVDDARKSPALRHDCWDFARPITRARRGGVPVGAERRADARVDRAIDRPSRSRDPAASAAAVATVPAARALAPARWETLDRPITTSADAERAEIDGDAPRFCIVRLARAARADPSSCPAAGAAAASEGGSPAGGSPGGACVGRASCGERSTEVSKARFRCRDLAGKRDGRHIFPKPRDAGFRVKRALTVDTSAAAGGTSAAAGTSAAGCSWGARRSPAGGSLAASSPSVSRNVSGTSSPWVRPRACFAWVCATGGTRSLVCGVRGSRSARES